MREYVVENEFVKAVRKAGGVAYKLNSQTTNGLPDRMVLFFPGKTVFVELKAPGKQMRPLQIKRRYQLQKMGFPVFCIDRFSQIKPAIEAILAWNPGEPFPENIGAKVPELDISHLPTFEDMEDFGETMEPEDPSELEMFDDLDPEDTDKSEEASSEYYPGSICDDCQIGRNLSCGHAYGRHYDVWGEGLGKPGYCPQKTPEELPF